MQNIVNQSGSSIKVQYGITPDSGNYYLTFTNNPLLLIYLALLGSSIAEIHVVIKLNDNISGDNGYHTYIQEYYQSNNGGYGSGNYCAFYKGAQYHINNSYAYMLFST